MGLLWLIVVQVGLWKRSMLVMLEIMSVLSEHSNIILDDTADASEERSQQPAADEQGQLRVWGNLVAFVERLDDEMFKSLQVKPHLGSAGAVGAAAAAGGSSAGGWCRAKE
jgi:hypothetical protein